MPPEFIVKQLLALVVLCGLSLPSQADAFCGFFVAPGDAKLVNNATRVALMRHEKTTIMSLQPDYQGPAEEFALVIPVPEILKKENVKTLQPALFDTLDQYSSPRMSEYWERDPCPKPVRKATPLSDTADFERSRRPSMKTSEGDNPKAFVKIEAQFAVGEYDIVILNSNDATALENWLVDQKYKIPAGAAPYLAPYISSGKYFFVAKVDPKRAKFDGNNAVLSPLRFHFTSEDFSLPIRLGMINAAQEQDIVVFVLAEQRHVPGNYPHAPIPTNIVVKNKTRDDFAGFYEGLFRETRKQNEDAIITEYAWEIATVQARGEQIQQGVKCDPCTSPVEYFTPQWLMSLGLDVLGVQPTPNALAPQPRMGDEPTTLDAPKRTVNAPKKLVLTRLHGRFTPGQSNPDIIFQKAEPLLGGMGTPDKKGRLEKTVHLSDGQLNRFQGRYVILHKWTEEIKCKNPQRGRWGGPPPGYIPPTAGKPRFGGQKLTAQKPQKFSQSKIDYSPPKPAQ